MSKPRTARCGTPSGWNRHRLDGEKPCDACARAKREYDKQWRSAPDRVRKSRLNARAQRKAYGRLSRLYPEDYAKFYAEEKARLIEESK